MRRCLDEGILQGYLDGELSPDVTREAAAHLSACDRCAEALASAAQEGDLFAAAFGPDESLVVPTEALRARVEAAVARLEASDEAPARPRANWSPGALLAPLTAFFAFTPRHATAFAGLLAVVVFAAIFAVVERRPATERADTSDRADAAGRGAPELAAVNPPPGPGEAAPTPPANAPAPAIVEIGRPAVMKAGGHGARPKHVRPAAASKNAAPAPAPEERLLPGESDYRQAIASLSNTVEAGGDVVLRPAVRADFERNIAVLDKAIAETRRVALRNPKDKDAVSFLMSAYKSKVDLLSTVADQAQVATLGR